MGIIQCSLSVQDTKYSPVFTVWISNPKGNRRFITSWQTYTLPFFPSPFSYLYFIYTLKLTPLFHTNRWTGWVFLTHYWLLIDSRNVINWLGWISNYCRVLDELALVMSLMDSVMLSFSFGSQLCYILYII